jgi:hypothetical protein
MVGRFALPSGLATSGLPKVRVNRVIAVQTNIGSCDDAVGLRYYVEHCDGESISFQQCGAVMMAVAPCP